MTPFDQLHREIDRVSERRAELYHSLSEGHDPALVTELHELGDRLDALYTEIRALKARLRFGDRDKIVARARTEERLERHAA